MGHAGGGLGSPVSQVGVRKRSSTRTGPHPRGPLLSAAGQLAPAARCPCDANSLCLLGLGAVSLILT